MIFYTNRFIPTGSAGCARGPVILIRPEYRYDKGLEAHERVHTYQWWHTLGLHSFLYLFSKRYRLRAEIGAYKEQLKWPPAVNDSDRYKSKYASWIAAQGAEGYGINDIVSKEEAIMLLS